MTLPLDVESAASYLDGIMRHEDAEVAKQWETVRAHLVSTSGPDRAVSDIAAERVSQISEKGWTHEHDDDHDDGSLALAAALYATPIPLHRISIGESGVSWSDPWPWVRPAWAGREQAGDPMIGRINDGDGRSRHDQRRRLVIAGSLIVAEIERLDRAASTASDEAEAVRHG